MTTENTKAPSKRMGSNFKKPSSPTPDKPSRRLPPPPLAPSATPGLPPTPIGIAISGVPFAKAPPDPPPPDAPPPKRVNKRGVPLLEAEPRNEGIRSPHQEPPPPLSFFPLACLPMPMYSSHNFTNKKNSRYERIIAMP